MLIKTVTKIHFEPERLFNENCQNQRVMRHFFDYIFPTRRISDATVGLIFFSDIYLFDNSEAKNVCLALYEKNSSLSHQYAI